MSMSRQCIRSALRPPFRGALTNPARNPFDQTLTPAASFTPAYSLVDADLGTYAAGFTRSGSVLCPDESGTYQTFATDVPAREYRPGYGWGYVTHPSYTVRNLYTSHNIAAWGKNDATISSDSSSPESGGSSYFVAETAVSAAHRIYTQYADAAPTVGDMITVSVVLGPLTNRPMTVTSNASTGSVTYTYPSTSVSVAGDAVAEVVVLANGWVRVDMTFTLSVGTSYPFFYFQTSSGVGDVTRGLHIWCANFTGGGVRGLPLVRTTTFSVTTGEARWRNTLAAIGASPVGAMGLSAYSLITNPASSRHMLRVDDNSDANRLLFFVPIAGAGPLALNSVANSAVHIDIPSGSTPMPGPIGIVGNLTADTGSRTACNGVAMVASTDGAGAASGLTHWSVGGGIGAGMGMPMLVRRAWLHNANLSAADLIAESLK